MRLLRAHGLGNDYLVLEEGPPLEPALVRALCDRHRGVGGDGVLEPTGPHQGAHGVRIWNPDGTVAEKSGNGIRIFSTWLVRWRGAPRHHAVWTGTERVGCRVGPSGVSVEMGTARIDLGLRDDPLGLDDLRGVAVDLGNPHCVVLVDAPDLDALPWRRWGRALEAHPRFPDRTNVQVGRVAEGALEIRIWERGAGETLASGSSSCAAAAAAVATGRLAPGRIAVRQPGGTLEVEVGPDLAVVLHGPVEVVGRFQVDPSWLADRGGGATGPAHAH